MEILRKPRLLFFFETIHIPLWLVKDLCWLMDFKTSGVIVAVPTIAVAIIMVILTYKDRDRFLPNLSVAFWILANAAWMFDEFFVLGIRSYCLYPFLGRILIFLIFILQKLIDRRKLQ